MSTQIKQIKDEDIVMVSIYSGKPVYWLKETSCFFYDGWGLGGYVYSKEDALKAVRFYHKDWKVLTHNEALLFEIMIQKGEENPFANQELMTPMIQQCLKIGRRLSRDCIPQVISAQTFEGFEDHFPAGFLVWLDDFSSKRYNRTEG